MNTNYETVVSLIELLVKKAGFDLSGNYSEIQLQKTKDRISALTKERATTKDKKALNDLIENLKIRQANWENNAEMVGKSLVKAYEEGKDYSTVKARIELLSNLATKGTDNISVGVVYGKLKSLDSEYNTLIEKIDNTDYRNEDEKEMDSKYKVYLENKISSIENEVEALDKELESLRDIEIKDVGIVTKIKEYIKKLNIDREKIDKVVTSSINSNIELDVWQKLEVVKNTTDDKLNHAKELLTKTEEMLEGVRKNKDSISEKKKLLETEKTRCNTKLNNINTKLEEDDYENNTLKMIDVNNSEMMKLELESLKNKKDVIYVDVGKVKEELIKAWGKERPPIKVKEENVREKIKTEISNIITDVDHEKEQIKEKIEEITKNAEDISNELDELDKETTDIIENKQESTDSQELVEKVILEDDKKDDENIEKIISDLEDLIEKSDRKDKQVSSKKQEIHKTEVDIPKVEVNKTKPVVKDKKNKIELDW